MPALAFQVLLSRHLLPAQTLPRLQRRPHARRQLLARPGLPAAHAHAQQPAQRALLTGAGAARSAWRFYAGRLHAPADATRGPQSARVLPGSQASEVSSRHGARTSPPAPPPPPPATPCHSSASSCWETRPGGPASASRGAPASSTPEVLYSTSRLPRAHCLRLTEPAAPQRAPRPSQPSKKKGHKIHSLTYKQRKLSIRKRKAPLAQHPPPLSQMQGPTLWPGEFRELPVPLLKGWLRGGTQYEGKKEEQRREVNEQLRGGAQYEGKKEEQRIEVNEQLRACARACRRSSRNASQGAQRPSPPSSLSSELPGPRPSAPSASSKLPICAAAAAASRPFGLCRPTKTSGAELPALTRPAGVWRQHTLHVCRGGAGAAALSMHPRNACTEECSAPRAASGPAPPSQPPDLAAATRAAAPPPGPAAPARWAPATRPGACGSGARRRQRAG